MCVFWFFLCTLLFKFFTIHLPLFSLVFGLIFRCFVVCSIVFMIACFHFLGVLIFFQFPGVFSIELLFFGDGFLNFC